jgi:hypothetical protein
MNATFSTRREKAFALDEKTLKKLCDLLSDRVGPVSIELRCIDDVTREYEEFKKVFEFENPREKSIKSVRFTARSSDFEKSATVEFRSEGWAGISIDLEASEPVVTRLRSDMLDILGGTGVWYSSIAKLDFVLVGAFFLLLACVAMYASLALGWIGTGKVSNNTREIALGSLIGYGVLFLWGVGAVLLNRGRKKLFPMGAFLIGQGRQRQEVAEKVRWGVVVAFIVSLVAGFIPLAF